MHTQQETCTLGGNTPHPFVLLDWRKCSIYKRKCDLHGTIRYQCGPEHFLDGPSVIRCVGQDTWAPFPPGRCVRKGEWN